MKIKHQNNIGILFSFSNSFVMTFRFLLFHFYHEEIKEKKIMFKVPYQILDDSNFLQFVAKADFFSDFNPSTHNFYLERIL